MLLNGCPNCATDGKYFYYNRHSVIVSKQGELVFLGDMKLSIVFMTALVVGETETMLWNFANDYVVNSDLIEGNVGERIRLVEILHDYKYLWLDVRRSL